MVAAVIFLLLFATAVCGLRNRRRLFLTLFFLSWIAIALLFVHHATDHLDISL